MLCWGRKGLGISVSPFEGQAAVPMFTKHNAEFHRHVHAH